MKHRLAASIIATVILIPAAIAQGQDTLARISHLEPRALRSSYFELESAAEVRITAVGGGPQGRGAVRRFLDHGVFQSKEANLWDGSVWPANAWILDATTRKVVWELRTAATEADRDGLRRFDGAVKLPAGAYEVDYAALFPVSHYWTDQSDWRVRNAGTGTAASDMHGPYLDDGAYRQFGVLVRGAGKRVSKEVAREGWERSSIVSIRGDRPKERERVGFELDRALPVEVYLVGERQDGWQDFGWIVDAATRQTVWTARNGPGEPAGGAQRNRMNRLTLTLPAGKYLAGFVTDNSHQSTDWNETPPYDPSGWGLTIRVRNESDRTAVRSFQYEPVRAADAFVSLTKVHNNEVRWQRFSLGHPLDVQVFALGESSGGEMVDYGWIVDAKGQVVWKMKFDETSPAGGAEKNRVVARTIKLAPGKYTAYYRTDGSHSFGSGWNSTEPMDGEYWGITLAAPSGKRDGLVVQRPSEDDSAGTGVLARLTRVESGRRERASFTLSRRSGVRIYAVGEGRRDMQDYASIQDSTGRDVWEMKYAETEPAGGAGKNRKVDRTITLERGTYTVRFLTDDSHAWGDWNAEPPDDPLAWGVTVNLAGP